MWKRLGVCEGGGIVAIVKILEEWVGFEDFAIVLAF